MEAKGNCSIRRTVKFNVLISFSTIVVVKWEITGKEDTINIVIAAYIIAVTNAITNKFVNRKYIEKREK
jgi:hypothetical protein